MAVSFDGCGVRKHRKKEEPCRGVKARRLKNTGMIMKYLDADSVKAVGGLYFFGTYK